MGTQKNHLNETVLLSTQNMLTRESVTQALVLPPKMLVPKGLLIDISNNVNVMLLSKKLSITKGNSSYIMQKRVMVLVPCTFSHRDLSNHEVSVDTSYSFCVICSGQNTTMKNNNGQ